MKIKGFSLVEVLVGLALFSILMVTAVAIMTASIRGTRKAAAIALAKTEGAYALRAMEDQIRFSAGVSCYADGKRIDVNMMETNEVATYYLDGVSNQIASSGAALSYLTTGDVTVVQGDCPAVFVCTPDTKPNIVSICFTIDNAKGTDVTDSAGSDGIIFQSSVKLLNTEQ